MSFRRTVFLAVALILLIPAAAHGQSPLSPLPPLIRLTGMFLDPKAKADPPHPTLEVRIADTVRTFSVRDVESLTGARRGWAILRNVGAVLTFIGPEELVGHLQSTDVTGQMVTIEGRLYVEERRLVVTSVVLPPVRRQ